MKRLMVLMALPATLVSSALAEDVSLESNGYAFSAGEFWSDGNPPHPSADYHVEGKTLSFGFGDNGAVFGGKTLTVGAGGLIYGYGGTVTIPSLIVDGGKIACNNNTDPTIKGACEIGDAGCCLYSDNIPFDVARDIVLSASLSGSRSASIQVFTTLNGTAYKQTEKGPLDSQSKSVIGGDASAFNGQYLIKPEVEPGTTYYPYYRAGGTLHLVSATALAGNDGTSFPDKIAVYEPSQLYLSEAAAAGAHANNGMTVTGAQNWIGTVSDSERAVISMPITGTGALIKRGAGEVVFNGAFSLEGGLTVSEGVATISAAATFAQGTKVTVKAGASLALEADPAQFDLDVEAGGSVEFSVSYDPADDTTSPLIFTAETIGYVVSWPMGIRLTKSIPLPFHAEKRLLVAKIPVSAKAVTAEDFRNATAPSAYNLPNTHFEVVSENGMQAIYMVARPVVYKATNQLVRNLTDATDIKGAYAWSDELPAHSGADYVMDNGEVITQNAYGWVYDCEFPGESVTIASGDIEMRNKSFSGNVILWPGAQFNVTKMLNAAIKGTIRIEANGYSDPWDHASGVTLVHDAGQGDCSPNIQSSIFGDGYLKFSTYRCEGVYASISSTNSDWIGGVVLRDGARLTIAHPESIGGDLPGNAPLFAATQLIDENSLLRPMETMTFDRANRGFYIAKGGFETPEDTVVTVKEPICIAEGWLDKVGAGVLRIAEDLRYGSSAGKGNDGSVRIRIGAGFVGAAGPMSVYDYSWLDFADGAGIQVDPLVTGDALTYGLYLKNGLTSAGAFTLSVSKTSAASLKAKVKSGEVPEVLTVGICTVPTDAAFEAKLLTDANVAALRIPRFKSEIVKDEPEPGFTRYAVRYEYEGGMSIILR